VHKYELILLTVPVKIKWHTTRYLAS